jgi:hypothetical protein
MSELCDRLGIPRRTFNQWVQNDPKLAVFVPNHEGRANGGGSYWVRLDRLAEKYGIDRVIAYTLPSANWVKAVDIAKTSGIPRRSIARWCRDRPGFAVRIGRCWYVDLERLGADSEQLSTLASRANPPTRVGGDS